MPIIPCNFNITCQCDDSPFANLSAEAPDVPNFFEMYFDRKYPPLGASWDTFNCQQVCESQTSQEAAQLCAAQKSFLCITKDWRLPDPGASGGALPVPPSHSVRRGRPVPTVWNTEQSCAAKCPDGLPFSFTVPAHTFVAFNQAQADAKAKSYACRQAQLHKICLSSDADQVCLNQPVIITITASGKFLAAPGQTDNWVLQSGTLPPGLTFNGGAIQGGQATITGTPTTFGTYTFFIGVTDPKGNSMTKGLMLVVGGITNLASMPAGQKDTPYSFQLVSTGFDLPLFTIASGTLPDGLTLSGSGLISGTPTTEGTSNFVIQVEDML